MNTDRDDRLLLALEGLTRPIRSKVIQEQPDGGVKTATVELPSLLRQLEEAITATIGIGGSGSLAHQRNMLDADALHRFMTIASQIKDWARMVKSTITPQDMSATLTAWFIAYRQHAHESEDFYAKQMEGWARQIVEKLNPPKTREIPGACPTCGAESWWSKATREQYPFPLVTIYDPDAGANLIQDARSMCRACEQVWSVRELAFILEERDTPLQGGINQ